MNYIIRLMRVSDGKIVEIECKGEWDDNAAYRWSDGNYSCDCNRELFFRRAEGEVVDPVGDFECGESRFVVIGLLTKPKPGEVREWKQPEGLA